MTRSKEMQLIKALGKPKSWTAENITDMKNILFVIPPDLLMRVEDRAAVRKM